MGPRPTESASRCWLLRWGGRKGEERGASHGAGGTQLLVSPSPRAGPLTRASFSSFEHPEPVLLPFFPGMGQTTQFPSSYLPQLCHTHSLFRCPVGHLSLGAVRVQ